MVTLTHFLANENTKKTKVLEIEIMIVLTFLYIVFQSALHMLQTLCRNKHFNGFVTIYKETKYLFNKREKYTFPDWFSVAITDFLESYTDSDITVLLTMVTVLVMSRNPVGYFLLSIKRILLRKPYLYIVNALINKPF